MIQNVTSHGDGLSNFIQSLNGRSELVCGCYIRRRIVYKVTVGQRTHCSEKTRFRRKWLHRGMVSSKATRDCENTRITLFIGYVYCHIHSSHDHRRIGLLLHLTTDYSSRRNCRGNFQEWLPTTLIYWFYSWLVASRTSCQGKVAGRISDIRVGYSSNLVYDMMWFNEHWQLTSDHKR